MITAMLWLEQSGCSWRALPTHFGPWQDVYQRYHRGRQTGLWRRIRQPLQQSAPESASAA
jgi:transposase